VTVALKFADDVLPCESLAAQVTTVVPTGIMLEDAGVHVTGELHRPRRTQSRVQRSTARRPALSPQD
jgi:hypothetical protein